MTLANNELLITIKNICNGIISALLVITSLFAVIRGIIIGIKIYATQGLERQETIKSLKWFCLGIMIAFLTETFVILFINVLTQWKNNF